MQRYIQLRRLDDSVRKRPQEFLDNLVRSDSLTSYVRIVSPNTSNPRAITKRSEPN